jgi:two-component sensor histidine kinase
MSQGHRNDKRLVWVEEAMHRAANLQMLATNVERLLASGQMDSSHRDRVIRKANALLNAYQSLDRQDDDGAPTCAEQLRDIAGGLVEVFGHTVGPIVLSLELEPLCLTEEKRRALLLLASELVVNALLHAFGDRQSGTIRLALHHDWKRDVARLTVDDDGIGPGKSSESRGLGCCIVRELAAMLAGTVEWRRSVSLGGTEVVLTFPAPAIARGTEALRHQ